MCKELVEREHPLAVGLHTLRPSEARMMPRHIIILAILASVAVAVAGFTVYRFWPEPQTTGQQPWNSQAITANFVAAQLRQVDAANAQLVLTYELQNHTDNDYRLSNSGVAIMSRMKSDGTLSSQQTVELPNATF